MKAYQKISMATLLSVFGVVNAAQAQETAAELEEITVTAEQEQSQKIGEIKKTRRAIQEELIADTKDLVRYTTDVGIADSGRHLKGFAMRGVEGNRVGISIDGVNLPDSEENSLYARYGNFNTSRLTIDPELVTGIDIVRGSDSFTTGSGSLGGGVNYRTLDAADIVLPGNKVGVLLKNSYASKNSEWVHTAGAAYKDEKLDAVYLYSTRYGHEQKSLGNGRVAWNNTSGAPDPSFHRNHSNLVKFGYLFNEKHRVSAAYSNQLAKAFTDERSYNYLDSSWRDTDDEGERHNVNVAYEYFPTSGYLSYLKTEYDYQKTDVRAINYKGSSDFQKLHIKKSLDEIYDRNMNNEFHRIGLRLDSISFETDYGTHQVTLRTAVSQRDFKNENTDTYLFSTSTASSTYAIQHPIRTRAFYIAAQDQIQWNEMFSSTAGLRYDQEQLAPQELNAKCYNCDTRGKATTFKNLTGSLGLNAQVTPVWNLGYYVSTGYRVPSASEMFFSYKHPSGNWLANPYLKAERSVNNSINLRGENRLGHLNVSLYHIRYKDFLFEQETNGLTQMECDAHCQYYGYNSINPTIFNQAINVDKARISGLEVTSKVNLDQVSAYIPQGFKFLGSVGYSKSKLYGTEASLLSVQPVKVILGLSYEDPNDIWGIHSRWTYLGAKHAKDATIVTYDDSRTKRVTTPFPYLNGSATLFDVYGFWKVHKNVTLRAGLYNIFNRKYHTWDALRGINRLGTTNTVDKELRGLERFVAPGRNYSASVEIRF
ncbi:TonB-dependent hemoglobin/transferrin/lactoferrin family receptor [Actinobacillus equuli]|uniref:TonB-dependent hemoglobin/transferrin/lactoferrin family receptor n=1 Tax=Actinobacillus equuli TaxID=718 RepID=UPI003C702701